MAATYRKLTRRFWTDPKVQQMMKEKRWEEIGFLAYSITGAEACAHTQGSGIYEISRSSYENNLHLGHNRVNEIICYFNDNPGLLKYNPITHVIFVENFFKHNGSYKKGLDGIMSDYNDTFHKWPEAWKEFGQKYRPIFNKNFENYTKEEQEFLLNLFSLKDNLEEKPKNEPQKFTVNSLKEKGEVLGR